MKITNPTDEKHELIIDSKRDGKTSEIAEINSDMGTIAKEFRAHIAKTNRNAS